MPASSGTELKPSGGVHGSIRVPPQWELIRPIGMLSFWKSSRPKKKPAAVNGAMLSGRTGCQVILKSVRGRVDQPYGRIWAMRMSGKFDCAATLLPS